MPVITFESLNKAYGSVEVIHDIDLVMEDNEFTVFVGPSGCGKSTTLRMVAGLESVTSGRITMDGKDISNLEPIDRDIAMVFQDYALYPHMNVEKNMSFGLKLAKYPKPEIKKRISEVAEMLGLTPLLHRKPGQLSGGQREAMTLGDRIVVMQDGYIQQHGTPQELFETPINKFVAGFMGMPPMNFMDTSLVQENDVLVAAGNGFNFELNNFKNKDLLPSSGEVIVGVRPSALSLADVDSTKNIITLTIKVCEYIGAQSVLISDINGSRVAVEVESSQAFKVGDDVKFSVNPSDVYLFDRKSELAIY